MTTQYDEHEDDPAENKGMVSRDQIRALEKKAKKADELEAELAKRDREVAFRKAGVDPDDAKARYFVKGYDGELTAEAIRKEAEGIGLVAVQEPTPEEKEAAAAEGRVVGASSGAPPTTPGGEAAMRAEFEAADTSEKIVAVARKYGATSLSDLS